MTFPNEKFSYVTFNSRDSDEELASRAAKKKKQIEHIKQEYEQLDSAGDIEFVTLCKIEWIFSFTAIFLFLFLVMAATLSSISRKISNGMKTQFIHQKG